jgi:hypothetical protein
LRLQISPRVTARLLGFLVNPSLLLYGTGGVAYGRVEQSVPGASGRRKPGVHEAADHIAIEAMDAHKQCLSSTMRAAGEQPQQLNRAAGLRIETAFPNGRHTSSIGCRLFTFN